MENEFWKIENVEEMQTVPQRGETVPDFAIVMSDTYRQLEERKLIGKPNSTKRIHAKGPSYFDKIEARRRLQASFHRNALPSPSILATSNGCRLQRKRSLSDCSKALVPSEKTVTPEPFMVAHLPVKQQPVRPAFIPGTPSVSEHTKTHCDWFIQDCACTELPSSLSRCLECRQAERDNESAYCRFRDFRKLSADGNDIIGAAGFVNHVYDSVLCKSDASDIREWLPSENACVPHDGDKETAKFTLLRVAGYFQQLLDRERRLLSIQSAPFTDEVSYFDLPWKDSTAVRELCDVCSTTIFNLHVFCPQCGLCVCSDCFQDRFSGRVRSVGRSQDKYGWTFCTLVSADASMPALHRSSDMVLAHLIPGCNMNILWTLEELQRQMVVQLQGIPSLMVIPGPSSLCDQPSHWYMFNRQVLVLRQCHPTCNLRLFQEHWTSSFPLIVENVHVSANLWTPAVFADLCRDHSSENCIVDCRTGQVQKKIRVQEFWDGFFDCSRRLRDKEKRKLYLKLKDWPPGDKFASVLRDHYVDFCNALPIPQYTHPERGQYNLATKLPSFCLAPDLGPKMYTAYDMIFEPEKGTTNLHLDVSDAVNVLVNVTTPCNINSDYLYREIIDYLETQDLDEKDLERAKRNPDNIGALWTIFRPEDNRMIREFLRELARDRRGVGDPIHDQKIYLNRALQLRLEEECGVKGFTFVQMLGDAVFIPAGAAHQVQNLLCCIKVAEDFVSPEGVHRCAVVADEFRSLTRDHSNHEDKLQLPNIVTHAVKESIAVLKCSSA